MTSVFAESIGALVAHAECANEDLYWWMDWLDMLADLLRAHARERLDVERACRVYEEL